MYTLLVLVHQIDGIRKAIMDETTSIDVDGAGTLTSTEAATTDSSQSSCRTAPDDHLSTTSSTKSLDQRTSQYYSRRLSSDIDGTAKPLAPESQRSRRQRVSGLLPCANLRLADVTVVGRDDELCVLRSALGKARRTKTDRVNVKGDEEDYGNPPAKYQKNFA